MTTTAQVRQVVQPLLQRNPDLALVGRMIVIRPVHHFLRGVYVDRSLDPDAFVPTGTINILFKRRTDIGFSWGDRIYRTGGVWKINDPDLSVAMCEAIENQALPVLRPITTIEHFVRFTSKERFPHEYLDLYDLTKVFVDVARGDMEAACSICEYLRTDGARRRYLPDMQGTYQRAMQELCPLVAANDRVGLAKLLRGYEAESVKNLKMEKFWEATPFPIEIES
jgi:hypothetical protein